MLLLALLKNVSGRKKVVYDGECKYFSNFLGCVTNQNELGASNGRMASIIERSTISALSNFIIESRRAVSNYRLNRIGRVDVRGLVRYLFQNISGLAIISVPIT